MGSGKSNFCLRLLQILKSLCTVQNFDGGIVCCYRKRSAVPDQELIELSNTIRVHKGVPENIANKNGKAGLIILDDLLDVVYSEEVCSLFTRGSHHRNISVILITQNLFHKAHFCRDISLNAKYLVLLRNVRDKNQFLHLDRQVHPEGPNQRYKACLNSTKRSHCYLVLDLAQDTDHRLRFRTRIFPNE